MSPIPEFCRSTIGIMKTIDTKLKVLLDENANLPDNFLEHHMNNADTGLYLASCLQDQFLFIADSFQSITGYSPRMLLHHGIDRLLDLIHREDIEGTIDRIIRECMLKPQYAAKALRQYGFPRPFSLEYRLKHASGKWIWIRDTKCIVSFDRHGNHDKILGSLEDVTQEKFREELAFKDTIVGDLRGNGIVEAWKKIMRAKEPSPALTKREKEILALLGQGYSSKQLADRLYISINTVETHRRHLIEKFNVRNSVELVTKASRTSCLSPAHLAV